MIGSITDPVQCMNLCIAETSYVCRVAELYKPNSYCLLYSDVTFPAQNPIFNPSVSYDHYLRDCAAPNTVNPPSPTPPSTPVPPSTIFSPCVDNTDCEEIVDAECRYGKCQCVAGLSHNPSENNCVLGRSFRIECVNFNTHNVRQTYSL